MSDKWSSINSYYFNKPLFGNNDLQLNLYNQSQYQSPLTFDFDITKFNNKLANDINSTLFNANLEMSQSSNPQLSFTAQNNLNAMMYTPSFSQVDETGVKIKNPELRQQRMDRASTGLNIGANIGNLAMDFVEGNNQNYIPTMNPQINGLMSGLEEGIGTIPVIGEFAKGILKTGRALFRGIDYLGKKQADDINLNEETRTKIGASYLDTYNNADYLKERGAGKDFGLFSNRKRKKLNKDVANLNPDLALLDDISKTASDSFNMSQSTSAINANRRQYNMQGGYKQKTISIGKQGMKLEDLYRAKRIVSATKYQNGGKTIDPFQYYLSTLPKQQQDSTNYRVREYWEFNGKPKDFNEAIEKGMFVKQQDGWHAYSSTKNPSTGEIEFMKSSNHPTHYMEIDWYNSDDPEAIQFRNEWELVKSEPYWKYVKRKSVSKHKDGGTIQSILKEIYINDLPKEFFEEDIQEFEKGGKFNLIPEGALHARKHNIDIEGITQKGIPVVSESEGGEIEQHAEIECSEIIFRLEVTQKIEELKKNFENDEYTQSEKDNFAIEAGKLLTQEILYNTQDNTELINTIC